MTDQEEGATDIMRDFFILCVYNFLKMGGDR